MTCQPPFRSGPSGCLPPFARVLSVGVGDSVPEDEPGAYQIETSPYYAMVAAAVSSFAYEQTEQDRVNFGVLESSLPEPDQQAAIKNAAVRFLYAFPTRQVFKSGLSFTYPSGQTASSSISGIVYTAGQAILSAASTMGTQNPKALQFLRWNRIPFSVPDMPWNLFASGAAIDWDALRKKLVAAGRTAPRFLPTPWPAQSFFGPIFSFYGGSSSTPLVPLKTTWQDIPFSWLVDNDIPWERIDWQNPAVRDALRNSPPTTAGVSAALGLPVDGAAPFPSGGTTTAASTTTAVIDSPLTRILTACAPGQVRAPSGACVSDNWGKPCYVDGEPGLYGPDGSCLLSVSAAGFSKKKTEESATLPCPEGQTLVDVPSETPGGEPERVCRPSSDLAGESGAEPKTDWTVPIVVGVLGIGAVGALWYMSKKKK